MHHFLEFCCFKIIGPLLYFKKILCSTGLFYMGEQVTNACMLTNITSYWRFVLPSLDFKFLGSDNISYFFGNSTKFSIL